MHYSVKVEDLAIEPDRRYRILVLLQRSDRPSHFKFHCVRCNMPVSEIINADIVALSDTMDMETSKLPLTGVRCDGRFDGGRCNIWYFFSLGDN